MRKPISISIEETVIEKVESRAKRNNRSLSREIETILIKALRL